MICGPCTYSQGLAVAFLQTLSSATNPSQPSNGTPTPAQSCENGEMKDGSQGCKCTRETFGCSIHPNTPEEWIASMRGSLARILARQEKVLESREREAALSQRYSEQLTLFALDSFSSKIPRQYAPVDGMWFSANWWRGDTPTVMESLPRLILEPVTSGLDGGVWQLMPTPSATEAGEINAELLLGEIKKNQRVYSKKTGKHIQITLNRYVKLWPTPKASDGMMGMTANCSDRPPEKSTHLQAQVAISIMWKKGGGQLNPPWVEWLMGWPIGWTELKRLGTAKFRSKRPRPGVCSADPRNKQPDSAASERKKDER